MNLFNTLSEAIKPETVSNQKQYNALILDELKNVHLIPEAIAQSIVKTYSNDLVWGLMFCSSFRVCAKRVLTKYKEGKEPLKLKAK